MFQFRNLFLETPWHTFNQSLFMLVTTTMTWQSAREYCRKQNGDLASISSDEELQFLYESYVKDKVSEGKWSKVPTFLQYIKT